MNRDSNDFILYNTLTRKREIFEPLNPPFVGLYVCGPTVYGDAHLGHARAAITFDVLFRLLQHLGYRVRYVRNITDVGHLENDADFGEDKVSKKARLEQLEPMEVVHRYTEKYHKNMEQLNVLSPSLEPRASGHIIEQQDLVRRILDAGYAYEVNGSVYFDVEKFDQDQGYGRLSGRVLEDLLAQTRDLEGGDEKRKPYDFALWKKAEPTHIMRWPSPWGEGFPGWHLECSAMSTKYLGTPFDIHGGGMDLLFPHHECEIAQSRAADGQDAVRYWVHNNMITVNGKKMGRSLGNFINLDDVFTGNNQVLEQAYHPMSIRFFILQAHYRSTLDFSNEAMQAAEKGLDRLMKGWELIRHLPVSSTSGFDVASWKEKAMAALLDDLNTPILIAQLFDAVKMIHAVKEGKTPLTQADRDQLQEAFDTFISKLLGLRKPETTAESGLAPELIELIISLRNEARKNKDFATADRIRDELKAMGIVLKDTKDGVEWEVE